MSKCIDCGYCGVAEYGDMIFERCFNLNVFAPIPVDVQEEKDCKGFVQRTGISDWDAMEEKEREMFYQTGKRCGFSEEETEEVIKILKVIQTGDWRKSRP